MPRNYVKKAKSYKEEDLTKALEEVHDCISKNVPYSKRAIARKYNIQKDILNSRLKGFNPKVAGRKLAIPLAEQEQLAEKLKLMYKWGFGLFKEEVKDVVQEYVIKHNIQTPFTNNRPGEDWFATFKELHNLPVKKQVGLEVTRQNVISDPFIIYDFYKRCESEIICLNLQSKPTQIYNLYEVELCSQPSKTAVWAEIGKAACSAIQGDGKVNTTVLACVNAAGKALPPLIVDEVNGIGHEAFGSCMTKNEPNGMNQQNLLGASPTGWTGASPTGYLTKNEPDGMNQQNLLGASPTGYLTKNEPDGMNQQNLLGASPTGWMTSSLFHKWLTCFMKQVTERPLLILFDGDLSRLDINTVELALVNDITILKYPPHTSDLLQPLYLAFVEYFKPAWDKEVHILESEPQKKLTRADFTNILEKVWYAVLSEKNIKSGFESTGLFPTNLDKYPKRILDPIKLKLYHQVNPTGDELIPETETSNAEIVVNQSKNLSVINRRSSSRKSSTSQSDVGLSEVKSDINTNNLAIPSSSVKNNSDSKSNKSLEEMLLERIQSNQPDNPNRKRLKVDPEALMI